MSSAAAIVKMIKDQDIKMVDLKFTDLFGIWQHLTIPISQIDEKALLLGFNFDGSSLRGWQPIHDSDMTMIPDLNTAKIDPFLTTKSLSLVCDIVWPDDRKPYYKDPRHIARKAIEFMASTGIADTAIFGPEAEFFLFDHVQFGESPEKSFFSIDSEEGIWNSSSSGSSYNLGHRPRQKQGYFPVSPVDKTHDIRTEISIELEKIGILVERHHHEVATGGQGEINIECDELMSMADKMMWFKYIVKNVALRYGKTATFMPKPIFSDNGSGMHVHMSLWKDGKPLFAGDKYAGLSEMALHFVGGILKHASALCAFTNPTTNSYKRLVPGYEAPVKLAYSYKNRSAAIRIPNSGDNPKAKRIEFRTPDGTANCYLAFSALLLAGIDGIKNKIDPGKALDQDIYTLSKEDADKVPSVPADLAETLSFLEKDGAFLKQGDVFSQDFIDNWVKFKYENDVQELRQRPTPFEFSMYFDS